MEGVPVIEPGGSGGSAPASDRDKLDVRANGVHHTPARITGAKTPSGPRNHTMSKTSTPISADVFHQVEAPSPSIIPNPYHTPKPTVLSRRQKAKAKFEKMQHVRAEGQKAPLERTMITSLSVVPEIKNRQGTQGHVVAEDVLRDNTSGNQAMISQEVAAGALVSAYNAKHGGMGPQSSSAPISKYDFVSGILHAVSF